MQALILVGGEATRLRPLTCHMPKAMVPVLNKPFLEHVISYLGGHDVRDIVLAQGHLPKPMEDHFKDGSNFNTRLTYALEARPMNTAGAVKNAEQFLKDRFFVLNGDIFTDLDMSQMLKFHLDKKAKVTIALTPVDNPTAYGLIETDSSGRIKRFLEKPGWDQVTTNMINAGTYILEPEILNDIPASTNYSFERELFPKLLARGEAVYAFPSSSYWIDIGTPDKYLQVHSDLLNGKVRGYESSGCQQLQVGRQSQIDAGAKFEGQVLIGEGCSIGSGARIVGPVVLGPGTSVADEAIIQECVIWRDTKIGPKVNLNGCLVANDCKFEEGCAAEKTVIGDHITLSRNTKLGPGSRIWPPRNQ
jgi:mannose-1-phosphate guanylyltransferase